MLLSFHREADSLCVSTQDIRIISVMQMKNNMQELGSDLTSYMNGREK